ncbi:CCDC90 family protein [Thiomicrospira microaerophila]|uniref:DUF1640 domain-containing protein n=1 Tax=Thiomicrospira microaerophila TaxID=406020 RepID=UPI0012FE60D1|nr:DUF1640 domain-containing protein [Thiomicrospira microaerophila]
MSSVTFDRLRFVKTLRSSGMSEEQAEAIAIAVKDSQETQLVTKLDLKEGLTPVMKEIAQVDKRIYRLEILIAIMIAVLLVPVLKDIFV